MYGYYITCVHYKGIELLSSSRSELINHEHYSVSVGAYRSASDFHAQHRSVY